MSYFQTLLLTCKMNTVFELTHCIYVCKCSLESFKRAMNVQDLASHGEHCASVHASVSTIVACFSQPSHCRQSHPGSADRPRLRQKSNRCRANEKTSQPISNFRPFLFHPFSHNPVSSSSVFNIVFFCFGSSP